MLGGANIKFDWIAPGDYMAFHLNYAVGAVRFAANNLQSPGLYGSRSKGGNNVAMGWVSDGVHLRDSLDIEKTTAWSAGSATPTTGRHSGRPRCMAATPRWTTTTPW